MSEPEPIRFLITGDSALFARIAAAYTGESVGDYITRTITGVFRDDVKRLNADLFARAEQPPTQIVVSAQDLAPSRVEFVENTVELTTTQIEVGKDQSPTLDLGGEDFEVMVGALASHRRLELFSYVIKNGPRTRSWLATRMGITEQTVAYHARFLVVPGVLIEDKTEDGRVTYSPTSNPILAAVVVEADRRVKAQA